MQRRIASTLATLGEQPSSYRLVEVLVHDRELERKFEALEATSELERPRTVRAMKEILRIFR